MVDGFDKVKQNGSALQKAPIESYIWTFTASKPPDAHKVVVLHSKLLHYMQVLEIFIIIMDLYDHKSRLLCSSKWNVKQWIENPFKLSFGHQPYEAENGNQTL